MLGASALAILASLAMAAGASAQGGELSLARAEQAAERYAYAEQNGSFGLLENEGEDGGGLDVRGYFVGDCVRRASDAVVCRAEYEGVDYLDDDCDSVGFDGEESDSCFDEITCEQTITVWLLNPGAAGLLVGGAAAGVRAAGHTEHENGLRIAGSDVDCDD